MEIRPYQPADWSNVWGILEPIFRAGETYALPMDLSEDSARVAWTQEPLRVFVAVDDDEQNVLGTYYLKLNAQVPAGDVCNCGFAVPERARGEGVASRMCEHSQQVALELGYRAMQFNRVASSNVGAIRLWKRMGFDIIDTLPGAFQHPQLGFVDAYVMYKLLDEEAQRATPSPRAGKE